jgi:hypothetical protein
MMNERRMNVLGHVMIREVSPLARVEAISTVYFPQFKTLVEDLEKKSVEYRMWMATARSKRELGEGEKARFGEVEVLTPYGESRDELVEKLMEYAQRELSLS